MGASSDGPVGNLPFLSPALIDIITKLSLSENWMYLRILAVTYQFSPSGAEDEPRRDNEANRPEGCRQHNERIDKLTPDWTTLKRPET